MTADISLESLEFKYAGGAIGSVKVNMPNEVSSEVFERNVVY